MLQHMMFSNMLIDNFVYRPQRSGYASDVMAGWKSLVGPFATFVMYPRQEPIDVLGVICSQTVYGELVQVNTDVRRTAP